MPTERFVEPCLVIPIYLYIYANLFDISTELI